MSNRYDIQYTYSPHNKATVLDCSFIVDNANGNGFGIRSLKKSGRIGSVFMHTTSTPGVADNGLTNPNPASGLILVTLQDNYNTYLGGYSGFVSPLSGTPINVSSGLTQHNAYVITSLGTTTQAQWVALGLPSYIQAAVGVSFIASTSSAGSGTGVVEASVASGIDHIEVIGDANLMNSYGGNTLGKGIGMTLNLACYLNSTLTAPTNGTVIGMNFYMNNAASGV
jgi:hypothetical protein